MDTYLGDGLNLYTYVQNNPVRYVDLSGHCAKENGVSGTALMEYMKKQIIMVIKITL